VGDGAGHLIMRAAGLPVDAPELKSILARFLEYYTAHAADETTWMPGALEALDALSSYPLAICTNKPKVTTLAVLGAFGTIERFASIIGGGDLPALKPDPLPLLTIAKQLHCGPQALVIVGDGPQDIEAGKRAGSFTIGVRGGIASPERLLASDPDLVLHSLWELPAAITRLQEA
jgi:phosphoglycolate phosphatase